jgi:low affinity Fe/Cu permease
MALEEEERQERRDHLRFAAGMSDFMGVILGAVVILIMILLILSLVNWLRRDILSTFTLLGSRFQ